MKIIDIKTNKPVKAKINRFKPHRNELKAIKQDFSFNWELEMSKEVFSLTTRNDYRIVGLMSLTIINEEYRIHVNLIESSINNRGNIKRLKNIPHCLISFAAKQSFALGFDGFVSLYPKTELIKYYINEYGFEKIGSQLAIYGQTSYELIQKYLDEK